MTFHQRRQEGRLRETSGPSAAAASEAAVRTRGSRLFKELFHLTAERKRALKRAFFFNHFCGGRGATTGSSWRERGRDMM